MYLYVVKCVTLNEKRMKIDPTTNSAWFVIYITRK